MDIAEYHVFVHDETTKHSTLRPRREKVCDITLFFVFFFFVGIGLILFGPHFCFSHALSLSHGFSLSICRTTFWMRVCDCLWVT